MSTITSFSSAASRDILPARDASNLASSYSVERGDTLSSIAQRHGTDVSTLLSLNPQVANPDVLYPGDALQVPARDTVTVRSGDTLSGIAAAHGTSVSGLLAANPDIRNPDQIAIGQELHLPGVSTAPAPPVSPPSGPAPGTPPAAPPTAGDGTHVPGGLSSQYETGGRGPGTVSTGNGDLGGVSYGSYQLATNMGRPQEFLANEGSAWAGEFAGAAPGSASFSATWRDIAAREPQAFGDAQHGFIQRTHYDVQVDRVERNVGIDLSARSPAVQDVVWSTAVQHGPASNVVTRALGNVDASGLTPDDGIAYDRALIDAVYAERGRRDDNGNLAYFSGSSAAVQAGVAQRFVDERADAVAMLDGN